MPGRAIPTVPVSALQGDRGPFDAAVKENLDRLLGRLGGQVETLPASATLADVIAKINEIVAKLR